jgi:TonB family protein
MFGLPDPSPDLEELEPVQLSLVEDDPEDLPWPFGGDRKVIFLLDERISPRPMRLRDRALLIALVASFLLHLAIFTQLRADSLLQSILAAQRARVMARKPPVDNTPFYELVDMPKQHPEKPSRPKVPVSDLDRRAHGGAGAPAETPGSRGNTPELRLEPQGTQRAQRPNEPGGAERLASRDPGKASDQGADSAIKIADKGADAILTMPKEGGGAQPQVRGLKGLGAYGTLGSAEGAVPERKGGQVDLGPLSFDTEWYDWGPYAAEMLRRIRYHWDIPEIAQLGVPGVVRIHFFIERDGRVTGLEIQRESGRPPMDFAARDAILNASPLPPLPDDLGGVFHEGVTITFYYNTPVPERTGRG